MDVARVMELYGIIGVELFGEDTYRDPDIPCPILKEELAKLISAIVVQIWNKARKRTTAQYAQMKRCMNKVKADFLSV